MMPMWVFCHPRSYRGWPQTESKFEFKDPGANLVETAELADISTVRLCLSMTGDTEMKIPSRIICLLVAASMPLAASVAVALPSSASSSLRETAAAPIQVVQHRRAHRPQAHRAAPAARDSYGSYGAYGGEGVDDWSHWSPSYHP